MGGGRLIARVKMLNKFMESISSSLEKKIWHVSAWDSNITLNLDFVFFLSFFFVCIYLHFGPKFFLNDPFFHLIDKAARLAVVVTVVKADLGF